MNINITNCLYILGSLTIAYFLKCIVECCKGKPIAKAATKNNDDTVSFPPLDQRTIEDSTGSTTYHVIKSIENSLETILKEDSISTQEVQNILISYIDHFTDNDEAIFQCAAKSLNEVLRHNKIPDSNTANIIISSLIDLFNKIGPFEKVIVEKDNERTIQHLILNSFFPKLLKIEIKDEQTVNSLVALLLNTVNKANGKEQRSILDTFKALHNSTRSFQSETLRAEIQFFLQAIYTPEPLCDFADMTAYQILKIIANSDYKEQLSDLKDKISKALNHYEEKHSYTL